MDDETIPVPPAPEPQEQDQTTTMAATTPPGAPATTPLRPEPTGIAPAPPLNGARGWWSRQTRSAQRGVGCASLVIALTLICGLCGMMANAASGAASTADTSAPTATSAATRMPAPTDTPANPNDPAKVVAYAQVAQADTKPIVDDDSAISADCGAGDLAACRADLVTLSSDAQQFLDDLNANPAPPCLQPTDKLLRKALNQMKAGADEAVKGIDDDRADEVNNGTALIVKSDQTLMQATQAVKAAKCS